MKNVTLIIAGLLLCGCASYRIPTPYGVAKLDTFCKTVDVPKITATVSNDTITVEGYSSKGDAEVITASVGAIGALAGTMAQKMAAK